jgi:pimeloyl-ACP methyl ester carboxylesterase
MQVFENDGARISVRVDGSGDDTVVLIHGFPFAREIWNEQSEVLAAAHRVVALDLRGMGESSVCDGPYLMETLAGDVAGVLDALGVERASIVGHSLGGYVALAFARMYVERVARLALVCSRLGADDSARVKWRNELADRAESSATNTEIVAAFVPSTFSHETRDKHPEIIEKARKIAEKNDPRGLAAMLRGMALRDAAYDIAPDLGMPVLVVAGGDDALLSLEEARSTVEAFPDARLVVCARSGHLPMLEEPPFLSQALAEFTAG